MLAWKLRAAGQAAPILSFLSSATAIAATITWPSVQAGDIAYVIDSASNSSGAPTSVTPSGFTNIFDSGAFLTFYKVMVSRKICTGSESGSLTGMDGTNSDNKVLLVFRATKAAASVTNSTPTSEATAGNPASQDILASGQVTPLIVFGVSAASGTAAFSTASPAFDATVATSAGRLLVGYKIYNAAPADHTIDQNDLGTMNYLAGFYSRISF